MKLMRYTGNLAAGLAYLGWSLLTERHKNLGAAITRGIRGE